MALHNAHVFQKPNGNKCLDGYSLKKYAESFSSDWGNDDDNG